MYYNLQIGKRSVSFTYKSNENIKLGTYCLVDFANKKTKGIVVSKSQNFKSNFEIKEIIEVLDEKLDDNLFQLVKFVHEYYLEPYSSLIPLIEQNKFSDDINIEVKEAKKYESKYTLNSEQENLVRDIENSNDKFHLIRGITGSGKTIVYIELIRKAINEGKSCIFLVPEISLTPQFLNKLEDMFGDVIAIWHSKLSAKMKKQYIMDLELGNRKLLLGTRSAIFTKMKDLAYIIIDEEQENTYKQENRPRYHIKNVAIKRCMIENSKLILGSATPSFETYYQVQKGLIKEHILENRYSGASLPTFKLIDLNNENTYLTKPLIDEIKSKIEKNEQVLILLNRKAYSTIVKCMDCSFIMECLNCTYKLTYYSKKNILKCNQCENTYNFKNICSKCSSSNIEKIGYGIEKLEEQICELFDENRILRMDSDTMNTNNKIIKAYNEFLDKKYDILIGTSMIAKGFHFPNVTLVCIINADQMSAIADYKIQEKTYQLITQASGRAGRAQKKGEVLIQTFNTNSDLIKSIISNDYKYIYSKQMKYREALNFPPYSKNIKIILSDKNETRLTTQSIILYNQILKKISNIATIYDVADAYIYKVSERYRKIINIFFIKENERKVKQNLVNIINELKLNNGTKLLVDVDPTTII
ncbi:replication restart helicase PriA [Oceanivirga salmonicida]|uniref:replication restart helicase PriA n=1 Tax=Oceanivirga salmonicida TaxID=1769291 RepID=UPI0012E1855F|nr:primosomal protein N' [Oceanivirga salmonicida]